MYCHKCGVKVLSDDTFCYKCGSKLGEAFKETPLNKSLEAASDVVSSPCSPSDDLPEVTLEKPCKLAILSFILSCIILFGSVPALILSIISLKRIKEKKLKGKHLALWALIISAAAIVIFIIVLLSREYAESVANSEGGRI